MINDGFLCTKDLLPVRLAWMSRTMVTKDLACCREGRHIPHLHGPPCRGTVRTFNSPSPDEIEISRASTSTDPHRESHCLPYGRRTRFPFSFYLKVYIHVACVYIPPLSCPVSPRQPCLFLASLWSPSKLYATKSP